MLIVGVAACALLVALWKAGAFDDTVVPPTGHEASHRTPAQTQLTDNPAESTVSLTQEPMEDEPELSSIAGQLPDPAAYDRQLSPDTFRQAAPATQSVAAPPPAPATSPSPAAIPAQKHAEHKRPAPASSAIKEQKASPVLTRAVTITGAKPASPTKPRSTLAPVPVGTLIVAVQPWAEVWIDGRQRGISPPLLKLQLPPGIHTVELRNPDLPSYSQKVQIVTGQSVTLQHSFQ
ncbi:hypothetical protein IB260_02445 [Pseudomonas sp. PDM23]|uniref:PEGA domain-containing protein n=1 Tax=unclassified Pseudomonas TaxID=196821 RepID=UPI0017808914|nr:MULTISPECIES: PEGA domain-containing protein [unclassified Pseudomonas]MBD9574156.1 hypothetical protein [Pseudomonas sp. PDM23]MBD9671994.1 hypothetical protein [Pseudomonas sp. PDM21]